jgi:intein/homing endonuclease
MSPQEANEITSDIEINEEKYREKYPEIFRYVDLIQGTIVSIGTHPSACIVSPVSLDDNVGLCSVASNSHPVSQLNMKEIDSLNYIKLDILGLDCVGLINQICDLVGIDRLLPENIDFNDENVWNSIKEDTTCVFQWESDSAKAYLKQLFSNETIAKIKQYNPNFSYLDLLSVGNGAIRPAGASYRDELAKGIYRDNGHEALNKLLAPTLGYLVYQEQIINFLHQFCGYTMGEADVVRRCVDENTLITMATGKRKKIKDIQEGEEVVTIDDNGFVKYNKVNRVYVNGKKETVVIKTNQNHVIKVTPNHQCLTVSGWKEASKLSVGDCLMVPKKYDSIDDGLTPQQRLKCSDMFLIGMLLGDGCIGGNDWDIHFTNSDLALIDKFKECVTKRIRNHNEPEFGIVEQEGVTVDKVYSIRIKSRNYRDSVINLLKKFELNKASRQKHLPIELMSYPVNDKLLSLLGGLFSTDGGYVSQVNCFEYYTISEELAYDIHFLLGKCGICSYVYRSYVNGYDYYCYKVRIYQKDAVIKFGELILPYMVGNKVEKFTEIINNKITKDSVTQPYYNYNLPRDCVDEIIYSSINSKRSLNSIGITSGISQNGSITDVKAKRILMKLYCPMTYKLITSDYMPVKIKSIEYGDVANVYDLEIDKNHNYLADGLIVHNCFSKKLGTEQHIPRIKEGFIKTMLEKYGVSKEESEKLIVNFIQVIEDASSYLFSENHALPYSMIGYAAAWLRYYYPLEFLTVALNIYQTDNTKSQAITNYTLSHGIKILPPIFGKSKGTFWMDKDNNAIYKGIGSIKDMNIQVGDSLYEFAQHNVPQDFFDILCNIKELGINKTQLDKLIRIGYFAQFGTINQLLIAKSIYDAYGTKKTLKKPCEFDVSGCYEKETAKQYSQLDNIALCRKIFNQYTIPPDDEYDLIQNQIEIMGYTMLTANAPMNYFALQAFETNKYGTPFVKLYRLYDGGIIERKMDKAYLEKHPFKKDDKGKYKMGQIIKCSFKSKEKRKKVDDKWLPSGEFESILSAYVEVEDD